MGVGVLFEAADSLAKASTPEPWSKSRTSNWVARAGGLPAYIQHVSHGIKRSNPGLSTGEAIQRAIGVIKDWARGGKNVDAGTRAAAAKALAEWAAMKGKQHALQHAADDGWVEPQHGLLADHLALRNQALVRLARTEESIGQDGMVGLLGVCVGLLEDASGWSPTMRRVASSPEETERHDVLEGAQKVGMVARRKGYREPGGGTRDKWHAFAVNGHRLGGYDGAASKDEAVKLLRSHLEEAPARVINLPATGEYLVASPSSYGETSYKAFPSQAAARHAAGLPAAATEPEKNSRVAVLGESLLFDLSVVSGEDIRPLRRVQGARRNLPFDVGGLLVEAFHADELRGFHGRWVAGGVARMVHSPARDAGRARTPADARYEGGVVRASARARRALAARPQVASVADRKPEAKLAAAVRSGGVGSQCGAGWPAAGCAEADELG